MKKKKKSINDFTSYEVGLKGFTCILKILLRDIIDGKAQLDKTEIASKTAINTKRSTNHNCFLGKSTPMINTKYDVLLNSRRKLSAYPSDLTRSHIR